MGGRERGRQRDGTTMRREREVGREKGPPWEGEREVGREMEPP